MAESVEFEARSAFKELLADFIFKLSVLMALTIDFNHQLGGKAVKVCDEPFNGVLAAKFYACELIATECLPERFFCKGWFVAHLTRKGF